MSAWVIPDSQELTSPFTELAGHDTLLIKCQCKDAQKIQNTKVISASGMTTASSLFCHLTMEVKEFNGNLSMRFLQQGKS